MNEEEWLTHPVEEEKEEDSSLYRMETKLDIYDLEEEVRAVVDWDGKEEGEKRARLAVNIASEEMESKEVVKTLGFRQRIEIRIKGLLGRMQLSNFGGGEAKFEQPVLPDPTEETLKKWETNRKQVKTRQENRQKTLATVEKELHRLQNDEQAKPDNNFHLGKQELKKIANQSRTLIERGQNRLQELDSY